MTTQKRVAAKLHGPDNIHMEAFMHGRHFVCMLFSQFIFATSMHDAFHRAIYTTGKVQKLAIWRMLIMHYLNHKKILEPIISAVGL